MKAKVNNQVLSRALISGFLLVYLAVNIVWLCPPFPSKQDLLKPFVPVWHAFGLRQGWNLFGPKLRDINYHTTATITYKDGLIEVWEFPRMNKLSLWERFKKEKWRKWCDDTMPWPDYREFLPDVARYVARLHNNPQDPPVRVSLNLHWTKIPPPEVNLPVTQLPEHTTFNTIFVYDVRPGDLR